jgi:hypothetical protein
MTPDTLAGQFLARRRADRNYRRVRQAALHRNRVELLCHRFSAADHYHAILLDNLFGDAGRSKEADSN